MSLWHLKMLRGSAPTQCVEMLLEDAVQLGVGREDAADFFLTPSSVGGCGVVGNSDFGMSLAEYSTGRWLTFESVKQLRNISPFLGAWTRRLKQHGIDLPPSQRQKFYTTLAMTWGVRESALYGDVTWGFKEVARITPEPIVGMRQVPPCETVWDDKLLPVMVRDLWKRTLVERKNWKALICREKTDWLEWYQRRVSRRIFEGYLLGTWSAPAPVQDGMGIRFGAAVKRWAEGEIRFALCQKHMSIERLERNMLWLEGRVAELTKMEAGGLLWGQ